MGAVSWGVRVGSEEERARTRRRKRITLLLPLPNKGISLPRKLSAPPLAGCALSASFREGRGRVIRLTSAGYLRGVSMRTWRAGGRPRWGTLRTWRAGARACGRGVRPRGRARRLLRSALVIKIL